MFHEALLGFGPVKEDARDIRMLQKKGFKIVRDFRVRFNTGIEAGGADT